MYPTSIFLSAKFLGKLIKCDQKLHCFLPKFALKRLKFTNKIKWQCYEKWKDSFLRTVHDYTILNFDYDSILITEISNLIQIITVGFGGVDNWERPFLNFDVT